jgi:hypothetical protein
MASDDSIRASDSDRETVAEVLRDAYSAGRLTLAEFDERTTSVYAGKTWGALRSLTADLPQDVKFSTSPAVVRHPPEVQVPKPNALTGPVPHSSPSARRMLPMVPILMIWLGVALTAREPDALIPVLVVLFLLLRFAGRSARHHHDDDPGDGDKREGPSRWDGPPR